MTALRLEPGNDLRASLLAYCAERQIVAACVLACVGSLEGDHTRARVCVRATLSLVQPSGNVTRLTGAGAVTSEVARNKACWVMWIGPRQGEGLPGEFDVGQPG